MGEFGDKFRKAREKKNLSLDDVSNVTKISSRNLQAIEEEHFDQLPGGVFNKGFIRAYARHVGLDGEQAVNEYLACLRQAQIDAQAVWEPENRAAIAEKRPLIPAHAGHGKSALRIKEAKKPVSTQIEELPELQLPRPDDFRPPRRGFPQERENRLPWRITLGTVLVLMLGAAFWQRHTRGARAEYAAPHPARVATTSAVPANSSGVPANPAVSSAALKQPEPQPPAAKAAAGTATSNKASSEADDDVTVIQAATTTKNKAAAKLNLVIRANENSWVSVTADGQLVNQETLIAPAHTSARANREIVAKVGNAAGVTFLWNGQEIPSEGAESEVKTYVFDASGMRVLPSPPSTPVR